MDHFELLAVGVLVIAGVFNLAYHAYMRRWHKREAQLRRIRLTQGIALLKENVSQLERLIELQERQRKPSQQTQNASGTTNSN